MTDNVLIKVENVGKKFCHSLRRSMLYGIGDIARDVLNVDTNPEDLRQDEFWAIENVSFEVKRGECLSVIGRNGAGKSTLLKMLNGIFPPDQGKITIRGKVAALIEVGAGFHPMLTGRENIYINGSILGMGKKEIDSKFDDIVAFAELEEFIDSPVKHYSSGMYVRLGFAIAAQLNPDVLLLDEVLAVGDASFRAKCFNQISNIMKKSAVVFVSHSMPHVAHVSSKLMHIQSGKANYYGEKIQIGIAKYFSSSNIDINASQFSFDSTRISDVCINHDFNRGVEVTYGSDLKITFSIHIKDCHDNPEIQIIISDEVFNNVIQITSPSRFLKPCRIQEQIVEVVLERLLLNSGRYYLTIGVLDGKNGIILARYMNCAQFNVISRKIGYASIMLNGNWSLI